MKMFPWCAYALLSVCVLSGPLQAQSSARMSVSGLDQLATEANAIVQGSVVSTKVEPHPQFQNLMTVVVRMRVTETLKGAPTQMLEFRQYVWDIRDELHGGGYRKGQEYLLLLGPVSEIGLRSPVGLEQGTFRIVRTPSGPAMAVNGRGNIGLFDHTEQRLHARSVTLPAATAKIVHRTSSGPLPLSDLKTALRSFAGGTQ
jgi:hypothetical protein